MILHQIKAVNFRLYDDFSLLLNPNTNILVGNNAQGKTSIIEAIHVTGITKSHKTNKDRDMIKNQQEYAKISSLVHLNNKNVELDIILSKLGKKAKYNQIELEKLSDYIGQLNVVLFAPEDLDLIKGNPQTRRKFLDLEIGQISRDYLFTNQTYKKVLKERNDLLKSMQKKNKPDLMLLDIITDQLIDQLQNLIVKRTSFIAQINDFATKIYKQISQSNKVLKIQYLPNIDHNYKEEFDKKYQYDIITGTTNLGAHRDDIEFYLDDFPIKTHGSQGELRTAVLSTKLALIEFIHTYKQEYPILLLDDVLSELDSNRQNNLIKYINNKVQTIITTTDISDIDLSKIDNYTVFEVNKGRIEESDKYGKHI